MSTGTPPPPRVFTVTYGGIARTLVTDVSIGAAFDPNAADWKTGVGLPVLHPVKAIWDTGATNTAISSRVVKALALKATGMAKVHEASHTIDAETYLVCLQLPSNRGFPAVRVTGSPTNDFGDDADVLIGMDVISRGDFAVTNFGGQTVMSFRSPSTERIDFVKAAAPKPFVNPAPKVGRNDPCPCGSGKKFKFCCGK